MRAWQQPRSLTRAQAIQTRTILWRALLAGSGRSKWLNHPMNGEFAPEIRRR
jgi:hypothetical protein